MITLLFFYIQIRIRGVESFDEALYTCDATPVSVDGIEGEPIDLSPIPASQLFCSKSCMLNGLFLTRERACWS